VVNERAVERLGAGLAPGSVHTSAYCQARRRLPEELIVELARRSGRLLHECAPDRWRWRRRRAIIVDGTTLSMPDTDANQERFAQHRGQPPGLGFPITRLLGSMCLSSGALLEAACGPIRGKGSDEHTLLRPLLDTLEGGDVLLGDASFPSYWLLVALRERGIDGLFEQIGGRRTGVDSRRGKRLGTGDHVIELQRPQRPRWMSVEAWASTPRTLRIRELCVGRGQRAKVLVTTMLSVRQLSFKHTLQLWCAWWPRRRTGHLDEMQVMALLELIGSRWVGWTTRTASGQAGAKVLQAAVGAASDRTPAGPLSLRTSVAYLGAIDPIAYVAVVAGSNDQWLERVEQMQWEEVTELEQSAAKERRALQTHLEAEPYGDRLGSSASREDWGSQRGGFGVPQHYGSTGKEPTRMSSGNVLPSGAQGSADLVKSRRSWPAPFSLDRGRLLADHGRVSRASRSGSRRAPVRALGTSFPATR